MLQITMLNSIYFMCAKVVNFLKNTVTVEGNCCN